MTIIIIVDNIGGMVDVVVVVVAHCVSREREDVWCGTLWVRRNHNQREVVR